MVASRWRRRLPLLALGLLVAATAAYVLRFALDAHLFTNDELLNVVGGRRIADDAGTLFDDAFFNRGVERLLAGLLALGNAVLASTPAEMRWAHLVLGGIYFLAAIPAYALARLLGLDRWAAVAAGALAIVTPWALYGTTLLNVTLAHPLTLAFAWALVRGALRPSPTADALVLAVALLMVTGRFAHAVFVPVALLAAAYATWLGRPRDEPVATALRRFPARLGRRHPLLCGAAAVALVALLVLDPATYGGSAYNTSAVPRLPLDAFAERLGIWFGQLTIATGFLPVLVGGAWALREIVRPRSVASGTYGLVVVAMFLLFVYSTANTGSTIEERYVAPLAGLPAVAFAAALWRRQAWPLGTLALGLLASRAIVQQAVYEDAAPFSWSIAPARLLYTQVILPRAGVTVPGPNDHIPAITTLGIALVAVLVAVAFADGARLPRRAAAAVRRAGRRRLAAAAVAPVLLFGALSGAYVLDRYAPATLPDKTFERMAWIDEASGGAPTLLWGWPFSGSGTNRLFPTLLGAYWNASTCCFTERSGDYELYPADVFFDRLPERLGPGGELPGELRRPELLARFGAYHPLAFESRVIARSTEYGPDELRVERLLAGPRASLRVEGAGPDGAIAPGAAATLRPLPAAASGRCARVELGPAADAERAVPYTLQAAGRVVERGVVRPGAPVRALDVALEDGDPPRIAVPQDAAAPVLLGEIAVRRC